LAAGWAGSYSASVNNLDAAISCTVILGTDIEPQPDVLLFTTGRQASVTPDDYIAGAPDFVCEISNSTESIDLNAKKLDYEKYGVREYMVVAVRASRVFWFVRGTDGKFVQLPPDADGILRSTIYPGLWLDPAALLAGDIARVLAVVNQGIASPEHAAFVAGLGTR
jgi:Uma2 family endonuclease